MLSKGRNYILCIKINVCFASLIAFYVFVVDLVFFGIHCHKLHSLHTTEFESGYLASDFKYIDAVA